MSCSKNKPTAKRGRLSSLKLSAGKQSRASPCLDHTHRLWIPLTRLAQGKEHFFLIKQKGFSSKDFPLLIFPCKLTANWRQLLYTFVGPVLEALHRLFPPLPGLNRACNARIFGEPTGNEPKAVPVPARHGWEGEGSRRTWKQQSLVPLLVFMNNKRETKSRAPEPPRGIVLPNRGKFMVEPQGRNN